FEVRRVNFNAPYLAWSAELDDGPVVTWTMPALCFPSVAHVHRPTRHDQIVPVTEKHVTAREDERTIFGGCEIDVATGAFELFPVRHDLTEDAQPRDATVRKDLEAQMRDSFFVLDWKRILTVPGEWHLR